MKDSELELLIDWRFVPIDSGSKAPKNVGWQKKHYTLDQIPQDKNIGVILGPASNGILAVDFDGPWTWDYWKDNIKIPFSKIDTVTWTSNKEGRCQMAFRVPKEFWEFMPVKFAINGPKDSHGKPQGLEFRWGNDEKGFQSVLPPSIHPETKDDPNIFYNWVRKPSEVKVQEIPIELLEWIYEFKKEPEHIPHIVEYPKTAPDDAVNLCEQLKQNYPTLDYDTWIRVTWAFCNEVGYDDGISIMRYYYPEKTPGEYKSLSRSRPSGRMCTLGTVKKMIKDRQGKIKTPGKGLYTNKTILKRVDDGPK